MKSPNKLAVQVSGSEWFGKASCASLITPYVSPAINFSINCDKLVQTDSVV